MLAVLQGEHAMEAKARRATSHDHVSMAEPYAMHGITTVKAAELKRRRQAKRDRHDRLCEIALVPVLMKRQACRGRLRATMEAIAFDLYCAAKEDPTRFVSYSRRKADYGETGEHRLASLTTVTQTVAFLEEAGFIETRPGSYSRKSNPFGGADTGVGYRSRIRALPFLVDLMEGVLAVTLESIGTSKGIAGRPLRLKDKDKRPVRFTKTAATEAMAQRVVDANRLRAGCVFSFDGKRPPGVHLHNIHLHRVFNNGRWNHGGRFYGGWWQMLNGSDRARILIDGETTVELDYRSFQPRICFHLSGQPLPLDGDPYVIPGVDASVYRGATKQAFAQLLSVGPGVKIKRAGPMKALFPDGSYAAFVEQVEAGLGDIRPWLRAGRGMELQFIDSEIADSVIAALTEQGIPCLPVHDSFVVPSSAEETLGRIMCEAYRDQLSRRSGLAAYPAIAGWSSSEMEERVRSSLPLL
jgi:hypothetical protein